AADVRDSAGVAPDEFHARTLATPATSTGARTVTGPPPTAGAGGAAGIATAAGGDTGASSSEASGAGAWGTVGPRAAMPASGSAAATGQPAQALASARAR